VAAALALGSGSAASANDASLGGCVVKLASVDAQNVPTFRGECVWSVAPASVAAVLTDPERLDAASELLIASERLADGRIVNLQKTGWPFEDRQSTLEVRDEPLPDGGLRRRYRLADAQATPREGAVQVGVDEGSYEIVASEQGTRLVLVMRYEPGGNLPTRIVQSQSPKYIARGLDDLRAGAEEFARANPTTPSVASGPPTE
jgi:hypothetical protein